MFPFNNHSLHISHGITVVSLRVRIKKKQRMRENEKKIETANECAIETEMYLYYNEIK